MSTTILNFSYSFTTEKSLCSWDPIPFQLLRQGREILPSTASKIAYHWGLNNEESFMLNGDFNYVQVQADIAKLIRRRCIAIVPIEATLKLILDHAEAGVQKSSQPKRYTEFFPVRQYEYVFLPLHLEDMLYVEDPASGEMNPLNPPFALPNLPTFVSYAHPYHVTLSSVDAVLSYGKSLSAFPWGKSLVNTFFRLAVIWRSPPPLQVMELPAEDSDSEGLDVSADIMTPPGTPLIKDSRTYHTFYSGQMIDIGSVSENTGSSQIRI